MKTIHPGLPLAGLLLALATACQGPVDAAPAGAAEAGVAADAAGKAAADVAKAGAAAAATPATPQKVDALPLRRGYYVHVDEPCGNASNATLALVRSDGISACGFTSVERIGEARYRVQESCVDHQGPQPETFALTQEYEILAEDRYRVVFEHGDASEFRFCPQPSLPEPWNGNDISDVTG